MVLNQEPARGSQRAASSGSRTGNIMERSVLVINVAALAESFAHSGRFSEAHDVLDRAPRFLGHSDCPHGGGQSRKRKLHSALAANLGHEDQWLTAHRNR